MFISPALRQRWIDAARVRLIRRIERSRGSRVITLIHREEAIAFLGIPVARIQTQIEREVGRPASAVFAGFDPQPLGSASIGQVHAARLLTGQEVVAKVQRPGWKTSSRGTAQSC